METVINNEAVAVLNPGSGYKPYCLMVVLLLFAARKLEINYHVGLSYN
jgi:hypothetical protein